MTQLLPSGVLHLGTLDLPTRTLRLADSDSVPHAPAPAGPLRSFDLPVAHDTAQAYLLPDGGGLLLILSGTLHDQVVCAPGDPDPRPRATIVVDRADVCALDASLAPTYERQPLELPSTYVHASGDRLTHGVDFQRFNEPLPGRDATMTDLLATGAWTLELPADLQSRPLGDTTLHLLKFLNDLQGGLLRRDVACAATGSDGDYDVFVLGSDPAAPSGVLIPFRSFHTRGGVLAFP